MAGMAKSDDVAGAPKVRAGVVVVAAVLVPKLNPLKPELVAGGAAVVPVVPNENRGAVVVVAAVAAGTPKENTGAVVVAAVVAAGFPPKANKGAAAPVAAGAPNVNCNTTPTSVWW